MHCYKPFKFTAYRISDILPLPSPEYCLVMPPSNANLARFLLLKNRIRYVQGFTSYLMLMRFFISWNEKSKSWKSVRKSLFSGCAVVWLCFFSVLPCGFGFRFKKSFTRQLCSLFAYVEVESLKSGVTSTHKKVA